ncbi:hypothetical protein DFH08DRAFT_822857 [Mycena albidolilacea]|uniref:DUF6532 domain-containing protein n=1 Tax=Mycena albidolilacea TaxID=1033008 RepID=A0AAD7ECJ7_9AGAR|nr:hypothetical protein DFH08DRAFT_822857 [Mycena albidolilacea]
MTDTIFQPRCLQYRRDTRQLTTARRHLDQKRALKEDLTARASKTAAKKKADVVSDSDDAPRAAPQAPETRRSHRSDPAQDPAELWDHDVDDADSEKSDRSNDEEHNDFEVEDEEDLQHVPADQARWQNDDGLDADLNGNFGHERPSSRASMSSGYMSVPASEPAADSDESEAPPLPPFPRLLNGFLLWNKERRNPLRTLLLWMSFKIIQPSCLPPRKERGKRDTARDNEKPRFIDTAMSTKPQGSGQQEPVEPTVRRQHVGKEHQSSPDIISISDRDDDGIQVVDSSSIEIVFRPEDGKVTLKMQHSRIERTVQLGSKPRNLLTPLLHGHASSFRLKAKNASDATVMANYALQGNAEEHTGFLITDMRYIYPLSPGLVITDPLPSQWIRTRGNEARSKELPVSMAAVGGTAVHASLNEHRTGHHVQSKFEGNAVQEIYDTHILLLDPQCAKGSTVLADLYDIMVTGSRLGSVAAKPMAMEALALLNL